MMAAAAGTYAARTCGNGSAKSRAPSSTATRPRGGRARPRTIYRPRCLTTIDTYIRRRCWDNGQKAADVPFAADMPRDRHRETTFRGSPDNPSSYGQMGEEGRGRKESREIIVREEEQIISLIERPAARRNLLQKGENTRNLSFLYLSARTEREVCLWIRGIKCFASTHNDLKRRVYRALY